MRISGFEARSLNCARAEGAVGRFGRRGAALLRPGLRGCRRRSADKRAAARDRCHSARTNKRTRPALRASIDGGAHQIGKLAQRAHKICRRRGAVGRSVGRTQRVAAPAVCSASSRVWRPTRLSARRDARVRAAASRATHRRQKNRTHTDRRFVVLVAAPRRRHVVEIPPDVAQTSDRHRHRRRRRRRQ